jgi:hypothetical protein
MTLSNFAIKRPIEATLEKLNFEIKAAEKAFRSLSTLMVPGRCDDRIPGWIQAIDLPPVHLSEFKQIKDSHSRCVNDYKLLPFGLESYSLLLWPDPASTR